MAAIKHDARVRMFLAGMWQDITDYVLQRTPVTITRGRQDETTKTTPSRCKLSLKNNDGRFTLANPMGAYYPEIGRNNPIQVVKRLALDTFGRTSVNSWGNSDQYDGVPSQRWTINGTAANFDVTPAGATMAFPAPAIEVAYMPDLVQADASVVVEWTCPVVNVTGDPIVVGGALVRANTATGEFVYARCVITTAETFELGIWDFAGTVHAPVASVSGLTYSAGTRYSVRLTADGETLAAKLWATASGEPKDYQAVATVMHPKRRGAVGIRGSVLTNNTNTPFSVTYHRFEVESIRFTGEVSRFPNASDASGKDRYVAVEASGILRRLGQGTSPTRSALWRGIQSVSPVAHWPCEEKEDATGIAAATEGVLPMVIAPAPQLPTFADYSGFACSAPIPTMNGTAWLGLIPDYDASAGEAQLRALCSVPDAGIAVDERLYRINTTGTSARWDLVIQPDGAFRVNAYDRFGANILAGGAIAFNVNGLDVRVSLSLEQLGADVQWVISTLSPGAGVAGFFSGTLAGVTMGQVFSVEIGGNGTLTDFACGHVTLQNAVTDIFEIAPQLAAYNGERALTRARRLSTENSVPLVFVGGAAETALMGPQRPRTYLELVRECSDADVATLFESRGLLALDFRTRANLYSQSPALTLDVAAKQAGTPFQPNYDDQQTFNDITAQRTFGGEFRAEKLTGPMSVLDPPEGVGRVDDTPEFNVSSDLQLVDLAHWIVTLGTQAESRFPDLSVDLEAPPVIAAGLGTYALDLDIDDLVLLTNASSVFLFDDIRQILRGYTETLGNHRHTFKLNVSPSRPFDLDPIGNGAQRIDSGSSALTAALTSSAMSFSVTTTDFSDLWTTTGAHFPLDVMIGGERIRLSAISGASSPQTFTVSQRSVNGVVKAHTAATSVHVANPWRLGL